MLVNATPGKDVIQFKIISMNFTLYFVIPVLSAYIKAFKWYAGSPKLHAYLGAHPDIFLFTRVVGTGHKTNSMVLFFMHVLLALSTLRLRRIKEVSRRKGTMVALSFLSFVSLFTT